MDQREVTFFKKKMIQLSSFFIIFKIVEEQKSKFWEFIYVFSIGWLSCIGGLTFGFETGMLSVSSEDMEKYYEMKKDLLTYVGTGATFVGGLAANWGANALGRRNMMISSSALTFLGGLCGLFNSKWPFVLGRTIFGVGLGMSYVTSPVFVAELSPEKPRGGLSALYNLSMSIGQAVPALLSTYFEQVGVSFPWRSLISFSPVLPFVHILIVILLPESPKWDSKQAKENYFHNIWTVKLFKCVVITCLLSCVEMCLGQHFITFYFPQVLDDQQRKVTFGHSLLSSSLGCLGTFLTVLFIDSLGRIMILNLSLSMVTIILFLLGLCVDSRSLKVLLVVLFHLHTLASSAFYPIPSLIAVEIYPMQYRALGCSFAGVLKWTYNIVISSSLEWSTSVVSAKGIFLICCFSTLLFTVAIHLLGLPDSNTLPLEKAEKKNIIVEGFEKIKGKYTEFFT